MLFAQKRTTDWLLFVITLSIVVFGGMVINVEPASAKTHEVKMTAVETELVVDGGGMKYKA